MSEIQQRLDPFFPLPSEPREKQAAAMDFIYRMVNAGYRDIVIAAPTGIGKTGIGLAASLWAAHPAVSEALGANAGGYYLVTQKLLQDQITHDFERFKPEFHETGITLKSATEYKCESHGDCRLGHIATTDWLKQVKEGTNGPVQPTDPDALHPCPLLVEPGEKYAYVRNKASCCGYETAKREFVIRPVGVTNYAYWLSERAFVGQFPAKNILIADECHSIEKQILGFIDYGISPRQIQKYALDVPNPRLDSVNDFLAWLDIAYRPAVERQYDILKQNAQDEPGNKRRQADFTAIENHIRRMTISMNGIKTEPTNWVYWCEGDDRNGYQYILKPLDAAPYFGKLMVDCPVRVYMSAYPGPKNLFCHTLGLDPVKVAWKNLSSTFPIQNRPVHMVLVGSMGQKSYADTLPKLLYTTTKILDRHADKKGLIHCHSYKLGQAIYDHLMGTNHAVRVLFPAAARDRNELFHRHRFSNEPTVLLSPSMTEGFSLDDDLARFQIIAKMPFPYLGDKQVAAKKDRDADWYILQTVMTIIQACGRIVRSDTDYGDTYILDRDFYRLYNEDNMQFFPKWFEDAFVWHQK